MVISSWRKREGKPPYRIRLEGIDAPEIRQRYGLEAKNALSEKVYGKDVQVEWLSEDKYGRILAHVYLEDEWINNEMVTEGWAWHFKRYNSDPVLAEAEAKARAERFGLWAEDSPLAPWDYRKQEAATVAQQPARNPPATSYSSNTKPRQATSPSPNSGVTSSYSGYSGPSHSNSGHSHYSSGGKSVHVSGYTRKDGTYVHPHSRGAPGSGRHR